MKCLIIGEKVRFRPIVPWKVVLRPKLPKIPGKKASPRKKIFGPPNLKILSTSLMKGEVFRASPEKSSFRGPCTFILSEFVVFVENGMKLKSLKPSM